MVYNKLYESNDEENTPMDQRPMHSVIRQIMRQQGKRFWAGDNISEYVTRNKDRLIDGLAYRGGSGLTGAAQIMFRAAIAALLNEAYYGADYPGAESTPALIALVNSKLALLTRTDLILLAGYFDFWNNAVHASLP